MHNQQQREEKNDDAQTGGCREFLFGFSCFRFIAARPQEDKANSDSPIRVTSAKRYLTFSTPGGSLTPSKKNVVLVLRIRGIPADKKIPDDKIYILAGKKRSENNLKVTTELRNPATGAPDPFFGFVAVVPREAVELRLFILDYPPVAFRVEDEILERFDLLTDLPKLK